MRAGRIPDAQISWQVIDGHGHAETDLCCHSNEKKRFDHRVAIEHAEHVLCGAKSVDTDDTGYVVSHMKQDEKGEDATGWPMNFFMVVMNVVLIGQA